MTVMYGVFNKEESMYILYAMDFFDADLFVKERGVGNQLEIDMVDLGITGKEVLRRDMNDGDIK